MFFLEAEVLPNTDMQVSSLRLFYNKPDTGVRVSYCWGLEAYDPEHGWGFDDTLGRDVGSGGNVDGSYCLVT